MGHGLEGRDRPVARRPTAARGQRATTLQALATPSRLRILSELRQGALPVGELAAAVGMERSAVSQQLRLLRNLRLVTGTPGRAQHRLQPLRQPRRPAVGRGGVPQ